jgi:hypothetical protein
MNLPRDISKHTTFNGVRSSACIKSMELNSELSKQSIKPILKTKMIKGNSSFLDIDKCQLSAFKGRKYTHYETNQYSD